MNTYLLKNVILLKFYSTMYCIVLGFYIHLHPKTICYHQNEH